MADVQYMARTRAFYAAQGFTRPYRWAHHEDEPFARVRKPLAESRLGLITTATLFDRRPLEPRMLLSAPVDPPPERLYGNDLAWAKESTHMEDVGAYSPLQHLHQSVAEGLLGGLASNFHCVPTEYSHRATLERDAPQVLERLRNDGADIALLVPL